jgi:ATP-dependent helicase/DNAse subunit B
MAADSFSAVWVSHSSLTDFTACKRAYFLKHIYRDPMTGHKIQLVAPPLALGVALHEVLESLSQIPVDKRFDTPLLERFAAAWKKVAGKRGGFADVDTEYRYKSRGEDMLKRIQKNPGPLSRLAIKIKDDLPHFWLSEKDQIILCGKIDWLEYLPEENAVHIIDFKSGKKMEDASSLQLPIYYLLVHHCQSRKAVKASYWYLELSDTLTEKPLPSLEESTDAVLTIAREVKLARQLQKFSCVHNGCRFCEPMERIVKGEGEFVGENDYKQDMYILKHSTKDDDDSLIL